MALVAVVYDLVSLNLPSPTNYRSPMKLFAYNDCKTWALSLRFPLYDHLHNNHTAIFFITLAVNLQWGDYRSFKNSSIQTLHLKIFQHSLKSMWINTIDNKTCRLNFSVTFNLPDKSRERGSSSQNSGELRSRLFSKISIVAEKFRIARLVLCLSHPCTFQILLRRGSAHIKITWVPHRQHHRTHKSARERILSLTLQIRKQEHGNIVCDISYAMYPSNKHIFLWLFKNVLTQLMLVV